MHSGRGRVQEMHSKGLSALGDTPPSAFAMERGSSKTLTKTCRSRDLNLLGLDPPSRVWGKFQKLDLEKDADPKFLNVREPKSFEQTIFNSLLSEIVEFCARGRQFFALGNMEGSSEEPGRPSWGSRGEQH